MFAIEDELDRFELEICHQWLNLSMKLGVKVYQSCSWKKVNLKLGLGKLIGKCTTWKFQNISAT